MKRVPFAAPFVAAVLLAGCAHTVKIASDVDHRHGKDGPDSGHQGGSKANLKFCGLYEECDTIPVTVSVINNQCTASFIYRRLTVEPGVDSQFALYAVVSTQYQYRFTDPNNDAVTNDPAKSLPGIDIDYKTDKPVFWVRYPDSGDKRFYAITSLRNAVQNPDGYDFTIHTEWSSDNGATWKPCDPVDPVIANN